MKLIETFKRGKVLDKFKRMNRLNFNCSRVFAKTKFNKTSKCVE